MKRRFLSLFFLACALPWLAGCIALPDVSRHTQIHRFEATPLASIPGKGIVYLVQRCGDRPDRREVCSVFGDNARYLALRPEPWDIRQGFVKEERDFDIGYFPGTRMTLIRPATPPEATFPFLIGDIFKEDTALFGGRPRTLRIWLQEGAAADFLKQDDPVPLLDGPAQVVRIEDMRPALKCETTETQYRIDSMVLPLPQTLKSYEGEMKVVRSCVPL